MGFRLLACLCRAASKIVWQHTSVTPLSSEIACLWMKNLSGLFLDLKQSQVGEVSSYLFTVESFRRVERLNERCWVSDEQSVARGPGQHTDHGQPDVCRALRRVPTEPDTQHVWQRLEQCPCVLLRPLSVLSTQHNSDWGVALTLQCESTPPPLRPAVF